MLLLVSCTARSSEQPTQPAESAQPAGTTTPETPIATAPSPSPKPLLLPTGAKPDPVINAQVKQYVDRLIAEGFSGSSQGVWIQTPDALLADHRGTTPLSAASLTKVATSLAALKKLGPNYQFVTQLGTNGTIENGVLKGDLIVQGSGDPFFVWETAIAVGNLLNKMGIRQVTGNLLVVGKFYMNYETNTKTAGSLLKQGMDARLWSGEVAEQYQTLPAGTPRPQVGIAGSVQIAQTPATPPQSLLRHQSQALAELLKKMNRYSNNAMAEMIANYVGGAKAVAQTTAAITGVPVAEIQLVNGSGLSEENRISPRAVVAMFRAIEQILQPHNLSVGDIFAVVGVDSGILSGRKIPNLSVVKSGSLNAASALAGVLPTENQGTVWFAIINGGDNLEGFRAEQEALLQTLVAQWGTARSLPTELTPKLAAEEKVSRFTSDYR